MGNLLRVLSRDSSLMSAEAGSTSCCSGIPASSSGDLFVDFESAQPSQEDFELFSEAEEVIVAAKTVLADLKEYKGEVDRWDDGPCRRNDSREPRCHRCLEGDTRGNC